MEIGDEKSQHAVMEAHGCAMLGNLARAFAHPANRPLQRLCLMPLLAVLAGWPSSSRAVVFSAQENAAYFGNLNQNDLSYSYPAIAAMACGPTAATNSLVYLENAFPSNYGNHLIASAGHDLDGDGSYTTYDDWIYTDGGVVASASYMNTTSDYGTYFAGFAWGLHQYVENKTPGKSSYLTEDYYSPGDWVKLPSWVVGFTPTWDFLYNALNNSAGVQVAIQYVGGGGHFLSVTGMTWDGAKNSGTLSFMDPWVGQLGSVDIRVSSGIIYTDYSGYNHSWISEINAISPGLNNDQIDQWAWANPSDHSQGVVQSSIPCAGGKCVKAIPNEYLAGLDLTQAYLLNANLTGAYLPSATLTDANLTTANLTNANLGGAALGSATLINANLTNANLSGAGLASAMLTNANLSNASLTYANLSSAILTNANLTGAGLQYATLTQADFTGAVVAGANFSYTALTSSQLYSTASYQAKDLRGIGLSNNNMTGWNFAAQNLTGATFLPGR